MNNIIAQPYAEALVELASINGQIADFTKDLLNISDLLSNSRLLKQFLMNPVISKESKKTTLNQLLKTQIHGTVIKFLCVLIEKNRMMLFDNILTRYLKLSNDAQLITVAYLTTAKALTVTQHNLLESKIRKMTKARTVKIKTQINPNLIGGLTLQIGSKVIDTSLFGQLQKMASHLSAANALT